MNGIEPIRESRQHGYWGEPIDNYECLDAERHVDYLLSEVDRLQAKLAHVERLERVVKTLLIDAEDSAGAAMLGLALDLGLLSHSDMEAANFSAWEPDRLCAQWALSELEGQG